MKISTIVPVYNCEKYIANTIENIEKQTYKNFEIILVNDGSKDKSKEICEKYSKIYNNIKVINIYENKGVSNARNFGIKEAIGDYIHFMDADDEIDTEMYQQIYDIMQNKCVDFIITGTNYVYNNKIIDTYIPSSVYAKGHDEIAAFLNQAPISGRRSNLNFIWNKLFKTDIIKKYNLEFDISLSLGEDFIFTCNYLMKIKDLLVIDQAFYKYIKRNNNITLTTRFRKDILKLRKSSFDKWIELYKYYTIYENNKEEMELYEGMKMYQAINTLQSKDCKISRKEKIQFLMNIYSFSHFPFLVKYLNEGGFRKIEKVLLINQKFNMYLSIIDIKKNLKFLRKGKK